jgi:hypothetical protein
MTLVVAKRHQGKIFIEADSKVTSIGDVFNNPYLFGVLKSVVVSPEYVVCYAGIIEDFGGNYVDDAFRHIWRLKSGEGLSLEKIKKICVGANRASGSRTDFIVASNESEPCLIKIDGHGVHEGDNSYWIGNIEAFRVFQSHFYNSFDTEKDDYKKLSSQLHDAFLEVLRLERIPDVSGFQLGISNTEGYFEYSMRLNISSQAQKTIPPKTSETIPFGDSTDGSFGISYFVSETKDRPSIGVHYPHGNIGVFFYPEILSEKITYKNVDDKKFVQSIEDDYGVVLAGFVVDLALGRATYIGKRKRGFRVMATIALGRGEKT